MSLVYMAIDCVRGERPLLLRFIINPSLPILTFFEPQISRCLCLIVHQTQLGTGRPPPKLSTQAEVEPSYQTRPFSTTLFLLQTRTRIVLVRIRQPRQLPLLLPNGSIQSSRRLRLSSPMNSGRHRDNASTCGRLWNRSTPAGAILV